MNVDLLELLACPTCGAPLALDEVSEPTSRVETGQLICSICSLLAPIVRSIPRFVADEAYARSFGYQWNKFRSTQLDHDDAHESERTFIEKTGIDPTGLSGKRVLEVGCGMGRFAEVCARHGARVVGVDLSEAVEPAAENLSGFPECDVIQADVFDLPLADESFDVIYSIGVLHHTPDTKEAFLRLPRLLRPGGEIAIWVYSGEPIDRAASGMKYVYRRVTPKLSTTTMLRLSRAAVPLYSLHTTRGIGFVSRKLLPTAMHPNPEWRILDTFDDYSPRYRWRHTYDEVLHWFAQAGLRQIETLEPRVAVRGRRPESIAGS